MQVVDARRERNHTLHGTNAIRCAIALGCAMAVTAAAQQAGPRTMAQDEFARAFATPPDETRPMMRWWWFGPAVEKHELYRELRVMQQAGIGGVEIQPVYPLAVDDDARGIRNLPYLSPEFLDCLSFANERAHALGLRVDVTLGSGWPYGGPGTTLALSAGRLKLVALAAHPGSMVLPAAAPGDMLLAAFAAAGTPAKWSVETARQLPLKPSPASVMMSVDVQPTALLLFYASHTLQQVNRPAVGAEGFVLDHFARAAIEEHLHDVADKLASSFGAQPPTAVFSDSLEVYGSDWTANLPAEFLRRRGYDLIPHLAQLYAGGTDEAAAVRNDWGRTLHELIGENYLTPLNEWAHAHGTLFRSQTYGEPAVVLADQALAALPEGEGPQWREFSYTRWASSASHLYGRNVTSAETFTWLHSPVFRATPLDMKVEADRMFLSGVNQIVGHGWPYTSAGVAEPGWSLYAAAVFDEHNPWFAVMPDVTRYLQRGSWLLRQGEPVTDVAILLPEDDAQAAFTPGHVSITDEMKRRVTPELMRTILDAGYDVDYVDEETLARLGEVTYPVVVMPATERMPLKTARLLASYVAHGGHLIATGSVPTIAPGLGKGLESQQLAQMMRGLFTGGKAVQVRSLPGLDKAIRNAVAPDMAATVRPDPDAVGNDLNAGLGFVHRVMRGPRTRDVYFVVNSSNRKLSTELRFRARHTLASEFSLDTGLETASHLGKGPIPLTLEPYESRVFVLSDELAPDAVLAPSDGKATLLVSTRKILPSLKARWTIQFHEGPVMLLPGFVPWNTLPRRKFYSGEAIYRRTFQLDAGFSRGRGVVLDFGEPRATMDTRKPGSAGIHALLDPPVREAAIVFVNGRRAGSIWHPPYALTIGGLLKPGDNEIELHVYNTAVNLLAGRPAPDDSKLNAKYGKRFERQDMDQIRSLASGLRVTPALRFAER